VWRLGGNLRRDNSISSSGELIIVNESSTASVPLHAETRGS